MSEVLIEFKNAHSYKQGGKNIVFFHIEHLAEKSKT